MTTVYTYDSRNRPIKIEHKDGAAVKQSFAYTLDAVGNILKTTHEDGSFWDYDYDGHYRLTSAVRSNKATPTISASYTYTYDKGDNMTQKVTPLEDDFNDGNYNGWLVWSSTWSAANSWMQRTSGAGSFYKSNSDADFELWFSYLSTDTSNNSYEASTYLRSVSGSGYIRLLIYPDKMQLLQLNGGVYTALASNTSATTTQDTWYDVYIKADGANIEVWRGERDGTAGMAQVLSTGSAAFLTTNSLSFLPSSAAGTAYQYDNLRLNADGHTTTTTFAYDSANELTSMTATNAGTTNFTYDAWGRMVSKSMGSQTATYTYANQDIVNVDTTFHDEGNVAYAYRGDGLRHSRSSAAGIAFYNWDGGGILPISEQDTAGSLLRTYIGYADAYVEGANPAVGSYRYAFHDNTGSVRSLFDENRSQLGRLEFTPYGQTYSINVSIPAPNRFGGYYWDSEVSGYLTTYRVYSPGISRWLDRDPLFMVDGPNMYAYAIGNPLLYVDPEGSNILINIGRQLLKLLLKRIWKPRPAPAPRPNPAPRPPSPGPQKSPQPQPRACFLGDTIVWDAEGDPRLIRDLKVGDEVVSTDEETGLTSTSRVTAVFEYQVEEIVIVELENGDTIATTMAHPFFVKDYGWMEVSEVSVGNAVSDLDGSHIPIRRIRYNMGQFTVYNLTVEPAHTYHVGQAGILVHNKPDRPRKTDVGDQVRDKIQQYPRKPGETPRDYADRLFPNDKGKPDTPWSRLKKYCEEKDKGNR